MTPRNFDPLTQPEWNDAGSVDAALRALQAAHDEASATEAHDTFLWAVGNGQTGTFHPVVLAVFPELERLLRQCGPWVRRAVMEALIDLGGPFVPEAGRELHQGAPVQQVLRTFIESLRDLAARRVADGDVDADSARELIELIDDLKPLPLRHDPSQP